MIIVFGSTPMGLCPSLFGVVVAGSPPSGNELSRRAYRTLKERGG